MMFINNKFQFGQIVYLVTDHEQKRRMVTLLKVNPNGIVYELTCGNASSDHYECEISENVDVLVKTA